MNTTTTTADITIYVNLDRYGMADGHKTSHLIAEVGTYRVAASSAEYAAEAGFVLGNREGAADADGREFDGPRSVSVGDVIKVRFEGRITFWACARFGWVEIIEPANPVVELDRAAIEAAATRLPAGDVDHKEYVRDVLRALWRLAPR